MIGHTTVGKNNKARRAAKAKARRSGRRPGGSDQQPPLGDPFGDPGAWPFEPPPTSSRSGPEVRWRTMEEAARRDDPDLPRLAERMVRDDPVRGDRVAEQLLTSYVDQLWSAGWQPRELVRQARRKATKAAAQVIELAILADHEGRAGQPLDPRWAEQLTELGQRSIPTRDGWLRHWRDRHGYAEEWAAVQVAKAMAAIAYLPVVDVLIPPPGRPRASVHGVPLAADADDPVLRRVRKLLAKAESTMYDEEADSLTAKAHELMTKHAIDQAVLGRDEPVDEPRTMRLPIDAPYADAKSLLLQVVAGGTRCRTIYHGGLDLSSVVGHPDDLRGVELLFTSLLVQAQHSLAVASDRAGSRTRSQPYRSAFYVSFARRVGERLAVVTGEVLAEAGEGAHLPVLAAREDAVEAFFDDRFGSSLTSSAVRGGWDPLGSAHGRRAADDARFGSASIAT